MHEELSVLVPFVIRNCEIRQDSEGRFCINDLHKAAGGEARHKPGNWLMLGQAKELVKELGDAGIPVSEQNQPLKVYKGGNGWQGTFVCKELVYAYAMWISPAFHLEVIRSYDRTMVLRSNPLLTMSRRDLLQFAMDSEKHRAALEVEVAMKRRDAERLDRFAKATGRFTLQSSAKILGQGPRAFTAWLCRKSWISHRASGGFSASSDMIRDGFLLQEAKRDSRVWIWWTPQSRQKDPEFKLHNPSHMQRNSAALVLPRFRF